MATPPHLSPKLLVGVGSLLLTLGATAATMRSSGFPADDALRSWPAVLLERLRRELPRGDRLTLGWVAIAAWSVLVSAFHFGGVYYNVYTQLPWWDLLTHAMGGLGVAALLAFTFRRPTLRSPGWLVTAALAIGAGFEVYEFVFKTFWYRWSLGFYVTDTAVDLAINTIGGVGVAVAVMVYRRLGYAADADTVITDSDSRPDPAEHDGDSVTAETD